ncbi:MAG: HD domain-containing protein [Bacillota bacterium]|nr:HD domain-containing protein [Bacillota bacterium]
MENDRLKKQIEFIFEIDKLKQVYRQTLLMDGTRKENDAEHSWHLSVMSILLSEYGLEKNIDTLRIIKMLLIHDIVEIDAGDTYCYDENPYKDKLERERKAADRIFTILPPDQEEQFRKLWEEFEERRTPEARFAAALDRLQPLLLNYKTNGLSWRSHGITSEKVMDRNKNTINEGSTTLWDYAEELINNSIEKGYLPK